ncbi:MAG: IS256 family transposase [Bacteroidaceae bacterium]|nr:IS256 family transposase [Bacteroidaceae bacterium]
MAQINFTLDYEFLVGLFSESKEDAFAKLMEALLNQVILAESAAQLGAENYERSSERTDYRNGTRTRQLTTRIGRIELEIPRHRNVPFKSMLIENYQRNEQALIATMMEMVVQGVSTRKVQKVTEELCGEKFSKSMVSDICKGLDGPIRDFRNRSLGSYPFIMADAMYLRVRENHRVVSKAFLLAIGINPEGHKEILGFKVYSSEKEINWKEFFEELTLRGLTDVDLIVSDNHKGLVKAAQESFPGAAWQRCQVHMTRNILDKTPKKYIEGLASELRAMFNAQTLREARSLKNEIIEEYEAVAEDAMRILDEGFEDTMTIMCLPSKYRVSLRTTNIIERENKELRKRDKVIQIYPNILSAERLLGAVLMDHHNDWIAGQRLFSMTEYYENLPKIRLSLKQIKVA